MERTREAGDRWVALFRADELRGPGPFSGSADGEELVLVRGDGGAGFRAFEGRCPHQGALLAEGEILGDELVCRNHRWRFDVRTGDRRGGPGCLRACPVEVRDGILHVRGLRARATRSAALRQLAELPGPRELPVIGSRAVLDLERLHTMFERWAERYGPAFRVRLGRSRVLVLSDAALIQRALRERPGVFRRVATLEPVFEELGVGGVFSAEGGAWRPLRRLTMEALSPTHIRTFYPTLRQVAEQLQRRWAAEAEDGRTVDLVQDLKRFTADVATQLAFGGHLGTLDEEDSPLQRQLANVFPGLTRRIFAIVPLWRVVKLPAERRLEAAVAEAFRILRGLIEAARARLAGAPEGTAPATFLEAMILARDEEGRPYSDAEILGNSLQILLAGEDTTALTLTWAAHELCDAPANRAALQAEADAVLGDALAPPDLETAGRLELAGAVAQETMRLRPVAPLIFVEAIVPTELGDLAIPKGQQVCLLMRRPAMSAEHFHDPEAFRPERWLASPPPGAHDPAAHMPFGSGPRLCPGRSLALLELRVVLATLFRSFDLERVGERREVSERFAFTMAPRGLTVRLHRRGVRAGASVAQAAAPA